MDNLISCILCTLRGQLGKMARAFTRTINCAPTVLDITGRVSTRNDGDSPVPGLLIVATHATAATPSLGRTNP